LPEPKSYPSDAEYQAKWANTGMTVEKVRELIDQHNADDQGIQERLVLISTVERWKQELVDWRAKVDGKMAGGIRPGCSRA
jgi:DNA-binding transcriptional MerR regulator